MKVAAKGSDLYVMGTSREAFGWGRSYEKVNISGSEFRISGLEDKAFNIDWYDPWSGEVVKSIVQKSQNGELVLKVPKMKQGHPDVAFKISL